jgi:trimethylamine--corrinoid protein Co-methyltransferase
VERGKPDLVAKATARKLDILGRRAAARFDPVVDAAIRAKFKIHLPA